MKKQPNIKKLVLSALFLALAYILPFFTGQIQQIGAMLAPMHMPVMLCGFICGPQWGFAVGLIAPIFRSLTIGMPTLFPRAVAMACELATYALICGLLYRVFPKKKVYIYLSLFIAMIAGRFVWGAVQLLCVGFDVTRFGLSAFWAGAVVNSLPGIVLQLILVPLLIMVSEKSKLLSEKY